MERFSWSWTLVKLVQIHILVFFYLFFKFCLTISLFTSCWRCSRKEILLYIFHVQFSYTTFLFVSFPFWCPVSHISFSKLPTTSIACIHLKWEDFKVQKLCQSFFVAFIQVHFFYFCGLLGATQSSTWRWWSEWKIRSFRNWPSNYFSCCRKTRNIKALLILKISVCQNSFEEAPYYILFVVNW